MPHSQSPSHRPPPSPPPRSGNPRITAALAALGRNAIPVYALYTPGNPEPLLLPEVLSPALVLAELSRLPAAKTGGTTITQR